MCLLHRKKEKSGPLRGNYGEVVEGYHVFTHEDEFHFKHGMYTMYARGPGWALGSSAWCIGVKIA